MDHTNSENKDTPKTNNVQKNHPSEDASSIDSGLLEVVLALAALSVAVVIIPFELPHLINQWFAVPVVIFGTVTFVFSYLSFGDLYSAYLLERGKHFPGWWFGRGKKFLFVRSDPHFKLWLAIRFFGLALIFLVLGVILNWFINYWWISGYYPF